jgi:hypothetical protein
VRRDELGNVLELRVEVVRPDMRLEAHFLEHPRLLLAARLPDFLLLLVTVLRVVQDLADRRTRLRSDLDEVLAPLAGQGQRFRERLDADLRPVQVYDADLAGRDPIVDPRRILGSLVDYSGIALPLSALPVGMLPVETTNVSTFGLARQQ